MTASATSQLFMAEVKGLRQAPVKLPNLFFGVGTAVADEDPHDSVLAPERQAAGEDIAVAHEGHCLALGDLEHEDAALGRARPRSDLYRVPARCDGPVHLSVPCAQRADIGSIDEDPSCHAPIGPPLERSATRRFDADDRAALRLVQGTSRSGDRSLIDQELEVLREGLRIRGIIPRKDSNCYHRAARRQRAHPEAGCVKGRRCASSTGIRSLCLLLAPSLASAQTTKFQIEEATIEDIQAAIQRGELTSTRVVQLYLEPHQGV